MTTPLRARAARSISIGLLISTSAFGLGVLAASASDATVSPDFAVIAGDSSSLPVSNTLGSPALATGIDAPKSVASDANGNLVIADTARGEIELVAESATNPGYGLSSGAIWSTGSSYLLAGGGVTSASSSGSPALSAKLNSPDAVALDRSGNVVIADTLNGKVELLAESSANPGYGLGSTTWIIGDLYVLAGGGVSIPSPAGSVATSSALNEPSDVIVDASDNLVITDVANDDLYLLAESSANPGYDLHGATWTVGDLYVLVGAGHSGTALVATGTPALSVQLTSPVGAAFDDSGNLVIADSGDSELDVLALSAQNPGYLLGSATTWSIGNVYLLVSGVRANGVTIDASGDLICSNIGLDVIDALPLSAANPGYQLGAGTTWTPGQLVVIAGGGSTSVSSSESNALSTAIITPVGVAIENSGEVLIADQGADDVESLSLVPSAPSLATPTASSQSVALSWSAPARSGGAPVSSYLVTVTELGEANPLESLTVSSTARALDVTSLSNGLSYGFSVQAVNDIGASPSSAELFVTPGASASAGSGGGGSGGGGSGSGAGAAPTGGAVSANPSTSVAPAPAVPGSIAVAPSLPVAPLPSPASPHRPSVRSGATTWIVGHSLALSLSCSGPPCAGIAEITVVRHQTSSTLRSTAPTETTSVIGVARFSITRTTTVRVALTKIGQAAHLRAGLQCSVVLALDGASPTVRVLRVTTPPRPAKPTS